MENWIELKDYESTYYVSDKGRICSYRGVLKQRTDKDGYLRVRLTVERGRRISKMVHRLVAIAFILNPENKETVNHLDGNKLNNHVSNLEWSTRSENNKHAYSTGLKDNRGEKSGVSKRTNKIINEIRELWNTGNYTQMELGKLFKIRQAIKELF